MNETHLPQHYARVLTIAGSDSGGGAGIQADLKAIAANGGYGMSAITALTAQNTQGVRSIHGVPTAMIQAQIAAVAEDIGVDAVKIGMLHSAEVIAAVQATLSQFSLGPIILDPVMVATSGDRLLQDDALEALQAELLPMAELITPNLPEAEMLLGRKITAAEELAEAAQALAKRYGVSVLMKGGHLSADSLVDVLYEPHSGHVTSYPAPRIATSNTHGTGCTLSSAIATWRARGTELPAAVREGIAYTHEAIKQGAAYQLGQGTGPVHHFWAWWA